MYLFLLLTITLMIHPIIGGKRGVPGNLMNRSSLSGFVGCIKKIKVFRRKLDLFRQGGNSNLQQCNAN